MSQGSSHRKAAGKSLPCLSAVPPLASLWTGPALPTHHPGSLSLSHPVVTHLELEMALQIIQIKITFPNEETGASKTK